MIIHKINTIHLLYSALITELLNDNAITKYPSVLPMGTNLSADIAHSSGALHNAFIIIRNDILLTLPALTLLYETAVL